MLQKGKGKRKTNLKRCVRCGLPDTWIMTRFDRQGVCNYCTFYETVQDSLTDFDRWQKLFAQTLDMYKGKFDFDAAVGFSGGKDSSYILHSLKNHYNCKVVGITVNFGFMPTQFALDNSKRVAESLGVEHIIYDASSPDIIEGFKNAAKRGLVCGLCTALCAAFTRKLANERQIPFYVMGADRGQLLRFLAPEAGPMSMARDLVSMLMPYSAEKTLLQDSPFRVKNMHKWLGSFGFSPELCDFIYPAPSKLPNYEAVPQSLQYFLYHNYQEEKMKSVLQNEMTWQRHKDDHLHSHHDCDLHDANSHFFREATGATITTGEICVDVREGEIRRDEAVAMLQNESDHLDQLLMPHAPFKEIFNVDAQEINKASKKFGRKMAMLRTIRNSRMFFKKPKLNQFEALKQARAE